MSEEEAIERLKERVKLDRKIRKNKIESDYEQFCENECQAIETILNLADKQQKDIEEKNIAINKMSKDISHQLKEIEEKSTIIMAGAEKVKQLEKEIERLDFENHMIKKWNEQLDKNCISKDKIREKIEKYEKDYERQDKEELFNLTEITAGKLSALKELLEDN